MTTTPEQALEARLRDHLQPYLDMLPEQDEGELVPSIMHIVVPELERLRGEVQTLWTERNEARAELAETRAWMARREADLRDRHSEYMAMLDQALSSEAELAQLRRERDLALWLHAEAEWWRDAAHADLDVLREERIPELETENEKLRAERDQLDTSCRQLGDLASRAVDHMHATGAEVADRLRAELAEARAEAERLRSEREGDSRHILDLRRALGLGEDADADEAVAEATRLHDEVLRLRAEVERLVTAHGQTLRAVVLQCEAQRQAEVERLRARLAAGLALCDRYGWDSNLDAAQGAVAAGDLAAEWRAALSEPPEERTASLTVDGEAGPWSLRVLSEPVAQRTEHRGPVVVDWTRDGRMVGVELLPAADTTPDDGATLAELTLHPAERDLQHIRGLLGLDDDADVYEAVRKLAARPGWTFTVEEIDLTTPTTEED